MMTAGLNKRTNNLSAITLALVVILLFIRINPIYYAAQFIPVRNAEANSKATIGLADKNHAVLRCQRGISEQIKAVTIPQIRFTGIPFTAFFTSSADNSGRLEAINIFKGIILSNAQRVTVLRSLRL